MKKIFVAILLNLLCVICLFPSDHRITEAAEGVVKIGLNYPETGPYSKQGLDQRRAAEMAMEEINSAGKILGKKVQLVYRDTKSVPKVAKDNAIELFDKEGIQMMFGGSSSGVAIASGKVAKSWELYEEGKVIEKYMEIKKKGMIPDYSKEVIDFWKVFFETLSIEEMHEYGSGVISTGWLILQSWGHSW